MRFDTTSKAGIYIAFINIIIGIFLFTSMEDKETAYTLTLISGFIGEYLNVYFLRTNPYNRKVNLYGIVLNTLILTIFMVVKIYLNIYL